MSADSTDCTLINFCILVMLELVLKHKMEKALCMVCPFWASIEAPGRVPAGSVDKKLILRQ